MPISNVNAAGQGWLGLPGIGHDPKRVFAGLEDFRRGTESEPGILLQDETLNWKWGPVVRRNSHPTPLAMGRLDQAQAVLVFGHRGLKRAQLILDPDV